MKVAGGLTKLATSGLTGSELGAGCRDDGIPTTLHLSPLGSQILGIPGGPSNLGMGEVR